MSDDDLVDGLKVAGVVVLVVAAVMTLLIVVSTSVTVGVVFGAGSALHNYWLAFRANVRPEKPARHPSRSGPAGASGAA